MAQQQVNVNIASVGFNGLNTEESPITQDYSFAAVADNAVIDSYGRVGARFAFSEDTTSFPSLSLPAGATTAVIEIDHIEGGNISGSPSIIMTARNVGFDAGGNLTATDYYMFERDGGTLVELTLPVLNDEATLQYAQIVPTDDKYYIFSETNEVMVWNGSALSLISSEVGYQGIQDVPAGSQIPPTFTGGIASNGRIWGWGHAGQENVIYYSDLLIGSSNYTVDGIDPLSTAGKLNVLENWPNGKDSIVGMASHNNRLVIFGRSSILVFDAGYGDPADPSSGFSLVDTITNVGCVSRDAIEDIGSDVLFLDDTGVRSLGRTIQERSSPMGNLTNRVRGSISRLISDTIDNRSMRLAYDASNSFVLAIFPEESLVYCLDMKSYLTGGESKVTRWTNCFFRDAEFVDEGNTPVLLFAGTEGNGVTQYSGYSSANNEAYIFKYYSNQINFGEAAKTKFVKQIDYTVISSLLEGEAFAKWGYDTLANYKSKRLTLKALPADYYNEAEFGIAKFGESDRVIKRYRVNTGGSGESINIGLEVTIDGNAVSLQEINVQTLIGRIN